MTWPMTTLKETMPSLSKLILVLCMAYGGADEDMDIYAEWIPAVAKAPTVSHRRPMFAKIVMAPGLRGCNPGVQYHARCEMCAECPACKRFNHITCNCDRNFRCMVPKNANSETNVPSDAQSDEASATMVPVTIVTISKMATKTITTKSSTTSTRSSTTLVPSTLATSPDISTTHLNAPTTLTTTKLTSYSDIPTKNFDSSTQAPTFGPTATVTPSEIPITRTTAMSSIIVTTIISTQGMHTTNTGITTKMTNRPVTATLVTSSGIPVTAATTTKTITNPSNAITSTLSDAGVIERFQGPFANTFSDAQCEVIDYRNGISLNQCLDWCETDPYCNAVNFNERHRGGSCVRRSCPVPISHPTGHETDPAWKGYSYYTAPWLHGGRCGPQHRLPDGRPGQCNPQGIYPCCNTKYGWCGKSKKHCICKDCIDYRKMN